MEDSGLHFIGRQLEDWQAWRNNDTAPQSQCSKAMVDFLKSEGLEDMEVFFRRHGFTTLRALNSLEPVERAVMLVKSREYWECLGLVPTDVKQTLNKLFGERAPSYALFNGNNVWAMHGGGMLSTAPAMPHANTYGHLLQAQPQVSLNMAEPQEDDTLLRRSLEPAVVRAGRVVGMQAVELCFQLLRRADDLARACAHVTAQALGSICIDKEVHRRLPREQKEILKDAKRAVRDALLFRIVATCPGLDSRDAVERNLEEALRYTPCSDDTSSQVMNGHRRLIEEDVSRQKWRYSVGFDYIAFPVYFFCGEEKKSPLKANLPPQSRKLFCLGLGEELAGGPPPRNRIALSPERRAADNGQQHQAAGSASSMGGSGPETIPAMAPFDPMQPNSSDPVCPHHADPPDYHEHHEKTTPMHVEPEFACPLGSAAAEKPAQTRSLPPVRRWRDGEELAELKKMVKELARELKEVNSNVQKLLHDRKNDIDEGSVE